MYNFFFKYEILLHSVFHIIWKPKRSHMSINAENMRRMMHGTSKFSCANIYLFPSQFLWQLWRMQRFCFFYFSHFCCEVNTTVTTTVFLTNKPVHTNTLTSTTVYTHSFMMEAVNQIFLAKVNQQQKRGAKRQWKKLKGKTRFCDVKQCTIKSKQFQICKVCVEWWMKRYIYLYVGRRL